MHSRSAARNPGPLIVFLAACAGLGVAFHSFFVPLTGVTGSAGALLVIASTFLLAMASIILRIVLTRTALHVWHLLCLLDILGTALAAFLLHEWLLVVAMAVALVGLGFDAGRSPHPIGPGTGGRA